MKNPFSMVEGFGRSREFQSWSLLCLFIFLLKILLFAVDPLPKFYMGDSGSYIWTALTGWIPEDRSFFYGYVIRWTSVWTENLTSLLVVQACFGAITCILFAWICRIIFKLPLRWTFLFGFICVIDPLQLLWERYVMTETISLCLYTLLMHQSLLYLRDRRLRYLAIAQGVSVVLIAFRMSFLLQVQISTIILPLLAFMGDIWQLLRHWENQRTNRLSTLRTCASHLLVSITLFVTLHGGYKRLNGWVSDREPAYIYGTGLVLLCYWSPILEPEDAADPRLADLIRRGDELGLKNPDLRNSQRFSPDLLLDRWSKIETNPLTADSLAKTTALHALRRDPLGLLAIAWRTYANYWSPSIMKESAELDFSFNNPPDSGFIANLATRFHHAHSNDNTKSVLQWYYVVAWPYYCLLLLAPLVSALGVFFRFGRTYAILLFAHISIMMATSMTFGSGSVRYLQPISLVILLVFALLTAVALRPKRRSLKADISEEHKSISPTSPARRSDVRNLRSAKDPYICGCAVKKQLALGLQKPLVET